MMMMKEQTKLKMTDLARDGWFSDTVNSTFWVRFYLSTGGPVDILGRAFEVGLQKLGAAREFSLSYLHVLDMNVLRMEQQLSVSQEGTLLLKVEVKDDPLPAGTYLAIATPHSVDGQQGNEGETRLRLDRFVTLLKLYLGPNVAFYLAFECEYRASDGQATYRGQPVRMPQPVEGPFLHPKNWEATNSILDKIGRFEPDLQRRMRLSLEYMYEAIQDSDFYRYWTAFEVLCGGGANVIRAKIQKAYADKFRTQQEVDDRLGLRCIATWRRELIHDGKRVHLSADEERFLQLLYLDLLERELWLPAKQHAGALASSPGVNLFRIGLADNRTEEQKSRQSSPPDTSVTEGTEGS